MPVAHSLTWQFDMVKLETPPPINIPFPFENPLTVTPVTVTKFPTCTSTPVADTFAFEDVKLPPIIVIQLAVDKQIPAICG